MIGEEEKPICSLCESEIKRDDDFCSNCGTLFTEFVKCTEHLDKNAEGVCVICCEPFCEECGSFVDDVFFCSEDSEYQCLEGRVNLFTTTEITQMDFIRESMEQGGLHPIILSERGGYKSSRILSLISPDESSPYGLLALMVPFQEVIRAEAILHDLELLE